MDFDQITAKIREEQKRQRRKYGRAERHPDTWIRVIVEEIGEAAKEIEGDRINNMAQELIEAAAVIYSCLESLPERQATAG